MSLLSSYEGLRQEIQRLAQENEELRRLVQLIQENQELKLVLRNRGSSLSFCGPGLLAEVAASPRLPRRRPSSSRMWREVHGRAGGLVAGGHEAPPVQPCSKVGAFVSLGRVLTCRCCSCAPTVGWRPWTPSAAPALCSPALGGVVGYSATTYRVEGGQPVIGFDMGGTSTDVSRYAGEFEHVFEASTAGVTLQAPQLDINTVAAGGGSRLFFRS
ncbi:PREDICTED: speriolin-like, partial [Bison bison bison]|uniref:Speriolin-like n=1 Tax=Bison bison bison TaxID=43346 RepID=A0A6P3J129_BISBB